MEKRLNEFHTKHKTQTKTEREREHRVFEGLQVVQCGWSSNSRWKVEIDAGKTKMDQVIKGLAGHTTGIWMRWIWRHCRLQFLTWATRGS